MCRQTIHTFYVHLCIPCLITNDVLTTAVEQPVSLKTSTSQSPITPLRTGSSAAASALRIPDNVNLPDPTWPSRGCEPSASISVPPWNGTSCKAPTLGVLLRQSLAICPFLRQIKHSRSSALPSTLWGLAFLASGECSFAPLGLPGPFLSLSDFNVLICCPKPDLGGLTSDRASRYT